MIDNRLVIRDKLGGAEEVGGVLGLDAGMFAVGGEIDGFGNPLYFANFGPF